MCKANLMGKQNKFFQTEETAFRRAWNGQFDRCMHTLLSGRAVRTRFITDILRFLAVTSVVLVIPLATPSSSFDPISLGAYIAGAPQDAAKIDEFTRMVGAPPALVMWYQDWAHDDIKEFNPAFMNAVTERGATPVVTWEPWDYTGSPSQPAYALRTIIAGNYDGYIRQWARDAHRWGRRMYLRFAHEMNGNWYPWSRGVNGNTSAEYIAAWQHVVRIFREEGATNVQWIWSPNIAYNSDTQFTDLYPGDDYVDWVALDGYNGGTKIAHRWLSLVQVFTPSYEILASMTNKPMMIAETASAEEGGNKADWIRQGFEELPLKLPRIRAVIWFDENKEADWRVNSSMASLAAYREVVASLR
jgi:Glycosyl hydrolase family 26